MEIKLTQQQYDTKFKSQEDIDAFFMEQKKILEDSVMLIKAYEQGWIDVDFKNRRYNDLYNSSDYQDIYDFMWDVNRTRFGYPVILQIKITLGV